MNQNSFAEHMKLLPKKIEKKKNIQHTIMFWSSMSFWSWYSDKQETRSYRVYSININKTIYKSIICDQTTINQAYEYQKSNFSDTCKAVLRLHRDIFPPCSKALCLLKEPKNAWTSCCDFSKENQPQASVILL